MTHLRPSHSPVHPSRRNFIKGCAAAAGIAALPGGISMALATPSNAVGLQLYTLRDMMAVSVPATLKLVAAVGYKELEFAGYYGHTPEEINAMMQEEGLTAPSAHIPLTEFEKGIEPIIEAAKTLSHNYLVVPYLTEAQRGTKIDTYYKLAERMNIWGEACRKEGIQLAYHNHDFEFEERDNEMPYDVLLNETQPDNVKMELDLYWTVKAGQDPLSLFSKHAGRFPLWHVKDMDKEGAFADVGTGEIDFTPIFAAASKAGLQHAFVERDMTNDRVKTIQQGYKAVSSLLTQKG